MAISPIEKEYFAFMGEYSTFLQKMLQDEQNKLSALQSKELANIEQSIVVSQANAKKLENYEAKRLTLQSKAGYGELTFREILDRQENEESRVLRPIYDSFERNVREIRFFNNKSMAVAKDNMQSINPAAVLPNTTTGEKPKGSDTYARLAQDMDDSSGLLQTKV